MLRANPLTWVFPSGSTIRQGLDSAVINMIVNSTWVNTREALEAYWFGSNPLSPSVTPSTVNMPTLVAALVLVGVWILGAVGRSLHAALKERTKSTAMPVVEEAPPVPIMRPAAAAAAAAAGRMMGTGGASSTTGIAVLFVRSFRAACSERPTAPRIQTPTSTSAATRVGMLTVEGVTEGLSGLEPNQYASSASRVLTQVLFTIMLITAESRPWRMVLPDGNTQVSGLARSMGLTLQEAKKGQRVGKH